jgi:hypothetical protein
MVFAGLIYVLFASSEAGFPSGDIFGSRAESLKGEVGTTARAE